MQKQQGQLSGVHEESRAFSRRRAEREKEKEIYMSLHFFFFHRPPKNFTLVPIAESEVAFQSVTSLY